jgi:hypothetical protein
MTNGAAIVDAPDVSPPDSRAIDHDESRTFTGRSAGAKAD